MRTIWKFPIVKPDRNNRFELEMPLGADVLTVQTQDGEPQLWAVVDPEAKKIKYGFYVHGTGHSFSGREGRYIGTFQLHAGALVFHIFEEAL